MVEKIVGWKIHICFHFKSFLPDDKILLSSRNKFKSKWKTCHSKGALVILPPAQVEKYQLVGVDSEQTLLKWNAKEAFEKKSNSDTIRLSSEELVAEIVKSSLSRGLMNFFLVKAL